MPPAEKEVIRATPGVITGRQAMDGLSNMERALVAYSLDPILGVKDLFGATPEDYQGEILLDIFKRGHDRVAAKSAHGTGKTAILSWCGGLFMNTRPNSRVVATAPVQAQLRDVLWPEFSKWMSNMAPQFRDMWELSSEHIRHKGNPNDWFAVARTSNKPENLQGFHNTFLFFLCDEASAIPGPVFEVIEGALSDAGEAGGESKLLMCGNPNFASGELFDAFNKNASLYRRYTLSGDPDVQKTKRDGMLYVSKRVTQQYRDTIARKYGKNSPIYDVRVRGQFPKADSKAIFPLEWLERAQHLPLPLFDQIRDGVVIACDPAREGDDESTLAVARRGAIIKLEARQGLRTTEVAAWINEEAEFWEEMGITILDIRVDEPGVGGGVIDTLRDPVVPEPGKVPGFGRSVTAYNGGRGLVAGVDPEDELRLFLNRRSRDHWKVRRLLETSQLPLPFDETMVAQGASIWYETMDNQKIKVESKKVLKARMGAGSSPDRMDVVVIALADFNSMASEAVPWLRPEQVISGRERATLSDEFM